MNVQTTTLVKVSYCLFKACTSANDLTPATTDCSKFQRCANGITYIFSCGPGTVFNPNLRVCDYPYNVPQPCTVSGGSATAATAASTAAPTSASTTAATVPASTTSNTYRNYLSSNHEIFTFTFYLNILFCFSKLLFESYFDRSSDLLR